MADHPRLRKHPFPFWLAAASIVAAVVGVYLPALHAPFVLADIPSIVQNGSLRHGFWAALHPPGSASTVVGRPVLNLSFALNYALGGLDVAGYHAVNIAIHAAAALALFGAMRRTCRGDTLFAWSCALLWAVHPLETSAVSYTVQRAESLTGLLLLFTLYGFIRLIQARTGAGRALWLGLSAAACYLGMGTKEVMGSAPFLVMLYDRTFLCHSWKELIHRRWKIHAVYLASLLWLMWLSHISHDRSGTYGLGVTPWGRYVAAQFPALAHYIRLALWPHPLVLHYGNRYATSVAQTIPGVLLVVGFSLLGVTTFFRPTAVSFLTLFLLEILETTSLIPNSRDTIAEYRMYLSLAALVIGAVWIFHSLLAWHSHRPSSFSAALQEQVVLEPPYRGIFAAVTVALALLLGAVTIARNREFAAGTVAMAQPSAAAGETNVYPVSGAAANCA